MQKTYTVDLEGYKEDLPIIKLESGVGIAFFNLHGNVKMTEHCGKALAKYLSDCEVLITAESKGFQLCHVASRELGFDYYAVARKTKKLYMQDGIEITIDSTITTGTPQKYYISKHDADLIRGKKVGIIDDVVSSGASLRGLRKIVLAAGGIIHKEAFCLAEDSAKDIDKLIYLDTMPLFYD